ncbi:MAG: energy-coupling factor ABC transporter permease [Methanosphaera sp.]|nr:energy-coupling factor ABC transporter permease [Methanosphaera sp.]
MHLPDGIIPLNQAIIYWIITIIIISIVFYKFSKEDNKEKTIVEIAIYSVFTTVISSLSIPSPLGLPIHFFTIALLVFLLGPYNACFVSFISLLAQAVLLGMGGITSFGANFLIIGFVISMSTYLIYRLFEKTNSQYAIFISTMLGILLATIGQIIALLLSKTMTLMALLSTLIPFYLFISIVEGLLTVMILNAINKIKPELLKISI